MSPASPTLPASLMRRALPSASAFLSVRRTTNSWRILPWLTTLNVTLPAETAWRLTFTDPSSRGPVTLWASVWALVVVDGEGPCEALDELPQPAAKMVRAAAMAAGGRIRSLCISGRCPGSLRASWECQRPFRLLSGRDDVARIGPLVGRRLAVVAV